MRAGASNGGLGKVTYTWSVPVVWRPLGWHAQLPEDELDRVALEFDERDGEELPDWETCHSTCSLCKARGMKTEPGELIRFTYPKVETAAAAAAAAAEEKKAVMKTAKMKFYPEPFELNGFILDTSIGLLECEVEGGTVSVRPGDTLTFVWTAQKRPDGLLKRVRRRVGRVAVRVRAQSDGGSGGSVGGGQK